MKNYPMPINLPLIKLRFYLKTTSTFQTFNYLGEFLRTVFGNFLGKIHCKYYTPNKKIECEHCDEKYCVYRDLFKPLNKNKEEKGFLHLPAPMIISPEFKEERRFEKGEFFLLNITLIGEAYKHIPHIIELVKKIGKEGLFKEKHKLILEKVENITYPLAVTTIFENNKIVANSLNLFLIEPQEIKNRNYTITIKLKTPLSLLYKNKKLYSFDFKILWKKILERISLLSKHYGNGMNFEENIETSLEEAEKIKILRNTLSIKNYKIERKNAKSYIEKAITGSITFSKVSAEFIPLLKIGEIVHIGRNTAKGFGKYTIKIEEHKRLLSRQ